MFDIEAYLPPPPIKVLSKQKRDAISGLPANLPGV